MIDLDTSRYSKIIGKEVNHAGRMNLPANAETEKITTKDLPAITFDKSMFDNFVQAEKPELKITPAYQPRRIIGNIKTDNAISNLVKNASQEVQDATYSIIDKNLIPTNLSGLTEEERLSMISLGMEQASYIAENYMDEETAKEYMATMETIARYGMNGEMDGDGKVTYNIQKGSLVGEPLDYVSPSDVLRAADPDKFKRLEDGMKSGTREGTEAFMNYLTSYIKNSSKYSEAINNVTKERNDWLENIDSTIVNDTFKDSDKSSYENFNDSLNKILKENNLFQSNNSRFEDSMNSFSHWLRGTEYYITVKY